MVVRPPPIHSIELLDELFLWGMPVSFNHHLHRSEMTFHRLFARDDDRFEAEWLASRVLSCVGFPNWELSDSPP